MDDYVMTPNSGEDPLDGDSGDLVPVVVVYDEVALLYRNLLVGGMPGSGKSGLLNALAVGRSLGMAGFDEEAGGK